MEDQKSVLLIGGGGTLGTYTAEELLRRGCKVDVICLEDVTSDREDLNFYQARATRDYLEGLFAEKRYDGIVNFIHYEEVEEYQQIHPLLSKNTDQLIFLSSYRVYADLEHPITEQAPQLLDVSKDEEFLRTEKNALSKARCEKWLREESGTDNWTVVRPVISFSSLRFDLVMRSGRKVIDLAKAGQPILLPEAAKDLTAGLDWAGNTGRIIANLLFREGTLREAYTISSAQNLTWGEVAGYYTDLIGADIRWVDIDSYWRESGDVFERSRYALAYDRLFDRAVDNSKVLRATGLKKEDFVPIREGLRIELAKLPKS